MDKCEIDLSTNIYSPSLFSRMVWQHLFRVYRSTGDLENMDSILCDLEILKKRFEKGEDFTLWWTCSRDYTEIADYKLEDAVKICWKHPNITIHFPSNPS